jgi:hypothetical protein
MEDPVILFGQIEVHRELNFFFPEVVQSEGDIDPPSRHLNPDDLLDTILEKAQTLRKFDVDVAVPVIHRARLHNHLP